jgi:predicted DNA-binding transcriptional regulator AlpA
MQVLRKAQQAAALGVSRWTVTRISESDPTYPRERDISQGVTGVLASEFEAWLQSRPVVTEPRPRGHRPKQAAKSA